MPNPPEAAVVKDAFDYVARIYAETSYLFRDLGAALDDRFQPIITDHGGRLSYSLTKPEMWLPRYISGCWVETGASPEGKPSAYLMASALFLGPDNKGLDPLLSYGVLRPMDHDRADYDRNWLWSVITNREGRYQYRRGAAALDLVPVGRDARPVYFRCSLTDASYRWPKCGYVVARPLFSVTSGDDVAHIVGAMTELWQEHAHDLVDDDGSPPGPSL